MRNAFKQSDDMAAFRPGLLFVARLFKSMEVKYGWETWSLSLRKEDM